VQQSFGNAGDRLHIAQDAQQQGPAADTPQEILDLAARLGVRSECSLPRSRKQHQAIEKTAKFVLHWLAARMIGRSGSIGRIAATSSR
jgi:hypothetical protein